MLNLYIIYVKKTFNFVNYSMANYLIDMKVIFVFVPPPQLYTPNPALSLSKLQQQLEQELPSTSCQHPGFCR